MKKRGVKKNEKTYRKGFWNLKISFSNQLDEDIPVYLDFFSLSLIILVILTLAHRFKYSSKYIPTVHIYNTQPVSVDIMMVVVRLTTSSSSSSSKLTTPFLFFPSFHFIYKYNKHYSPFFSILILIIITTITITNRETKILVFFHFYWVYLFIQNQKKTDDDDDCVVNGRQSIYTNSPTPPLLYFIYHHSQLPPIQYV